MKHDFNGSVVMITGAAQGLGLVIARGFADAGARIALLDANEKKLAETAKKIGRAHV